MICPNCKKENLNAKATECAYCHTPFYGSQEQADKAVRKIKVEETLEAVGKFFAVAVAVLAIVLGAIFVVPNLPKKEPVNNNDVSSTASTTQVNNNKKPKPNNNTGNNSNSTAVTPSGNTSNSVSSNTDNNDYVDSNNNDDYSWESPTNNIYNDWDNDWDDSYDEPETEETTTEDITPKYNQEIQEENQRHQEEIERINSEYDYEIENNEEMAATLRSYSGAYSSSSYYASQKSSLESELEPLMRKLVYLQSYEPNSSKTRSLEREVAGYQEELSDISVKYDCAQEAEEYEAKAQALKRDKQYAINAENERHEEAIADIKAKYNM